MEAKCHFDKPEPLKYIFVNILAKILMFMKYVYIWSTKLVNQLMYEIH